MNKRNLCVVAVIGAGLLGGASAAQADATDRLLARSGQFQLDNGETITVKRAAATQGYRICMDDTPHAVPLKVAYDDKEVIVAPGECRVVESRSVRLSSAARLHDGIALVGRFNGITTQDADSGMRVAQLARED
jgi:hypothetical protein